MKYLWLNQNGKRDNVSMEIGGFIEKENRIKVMENYYQLYESPKKVKRFRIAFTTDQINYLEKQFKKFAYIGTAERKEVAETLNIPERAIKIWFQNRRMKEKKESTTKEVDDEQGIRKCLDFTKEQLNNVNVPSVNEQPIPSLSLPLLTDLMQENCYNNMGTNSSTCNVTKQVAQVSEIKDSTVQIYASDNLLSMTTAKASHPPSAFVKTCHSSPNFKATADLSTDLWKKYKTESSTKSFCEEQQSFKTESEDIKKMEESKTVGSTEQIMPDNTLLSMTTAKASHPPSAFVKTSNSPPNFKTTGDFSIDLWKKYKTESSTKLFYEEQQSFKIESEDIKKMEESKAVGFTEQIMPDNTLLSMTTAKVTHPHSAFVKTSHSSPNIKTTAEFSIDLCKKYKTETSTKSFHKEQQSFKTESKDKKKMEISKTVGFTEQMMPEDLSPRRKVNNIPAMCPHQPVPGNTSSNSGFVSLVPTVQSFYTQPYISTSGVILKPMSVMPVVNSNSSPVAAPCNPLLNVSPAQDYYLKKPCNCDCHGRQVVPQVQYNFPQQSPSPQYIITLPFQNPTTKF